MNSPALRALIRRILLPIFIISLLVSSGGSYLLLYNEAIRQVQQEARIMLASAHAVGEYTETHILPKLIAMFVVMLFTLPWMIGQVSDYVRELFGNIPGNL